MTFLNDLHITRRECLIVAAVVVVVVAAAVAVFMLAAVVAAWRSRGRHVVVVGCW
jgi:hypothetical protein